MSDTWSTHPFTSVIDFQEGPGIMAADFRDQGVPLIRLSGLASERHVLDGCNFLDPLLVERRWRHFRLQSGDTLLSTSAALGRVAVVDRAAEGAIAYTGIIRMRPADTRLHPDFIPYLLQGAEFQEQAEAVGIGSVMRHFGPSHLRNMTVTVPPAAVQRKITAILSAFDDLIANNGCRITVLEELAERMYREWFVSFRYPGHESVPLVVDSDLGPIPDGWDRVPIGELASVTVGSTPSRRAPDYWRDGTIAWINSAQINDVCVISPTEMITPEAYAVTGTKMMPVGTTLIAITGATLGQVSYLAIPACGSQNVCGVYPYDSSAASYFYHAICASIEEIANRAMGGAQQHINRAIVYQTLILRPATHVVAAFCRNVDSLLAEIVCLLRQQAALRASRELLLPRLISGGLNVDDLNIALPTAAA